jgi:hypothetical protein
LVGVFATAISAVLVFVAGQIVQRFVIEPVQEQKRLIGEIAHVLLFYANRGPEGVEVGTFTPEHIHEASHHLRNLAGSLRSTLFYVPFYDLLALLGRVPKKYDVLEAAQQLVGWSNGILSKRSGPDNSRRRRIIAEKLGITKRIGVVD